MPTAARDLAEPVDLERLSDEELEEYARQHPAAAKILAALDSLVWIEADTPEELEERVSEKLERREQDDEEWRAVSLNEREWSVLTAMVQAFQAVTGPPRAAKVDTGIQVRPGSHRRRSSRARRTAVRRRARSPGSSSSDDDSDLAAWHGPPTALEQAFARAGVVA